VLLICIREEDIKTEYSLFHTSVPRVTLFSTAETILSYICQLLKKYLTEEAQKIQEDQIIQALHYHVNLNDSNLFNNENLTTIIAKASLDLVDTITPKFKKDINSSNQFSMNISYFNMLNKDHSDMVQDIKEGFIEEHQLYDKYLKEQQVEKSDVDNDKESCNESDKENFSAKDLVNSHKCKEKRRPKGTDRK
ncbi:12850_t:CDS:2, partial [Cetraspora pellucida]